MYLADYHLHTSISADCRMSLDRLCGAALDAGLREVCITDHWNLVTQQGEVTLGGFDWAPALAQWRAVRDEYEGRLEVRLGLEVGNGPLDDALVARTLDLPQLDFAIGSIHNLSPRLGNLGIYTQARLAADPDAARAIMDDYIATLGELSRTDGYDVVAHIIYPLRYFPAQLGVTLAPYRDALAELLRTVIQKSKGMEVNTSQGQTVEDWTDLLDLYRDLGGELLTFGSDAHRPDAVGAAIREARELARSHGFRWFATYRHRVPFFSKL